MKQIAPHSLCPSAPREVAPKLLTRMVNEGFRVGHDWSDSDRERIAYAFQKAAIVIADEPFDLFLDRVAPPGKDAAATSGEFWADVRQVRPPFKYMWLESQAPDSKGRFGMLLVDLPDKESGQPELADSKAGNVATIIASAGEDGLLFGGMGASVRYGADGMTALNQVKLIPPAWHREWTEEQQRDWNWSTASLTGLFMSVVSFMHCRNVSLEEHEPRHNFKKQCAHRFGGKRDDYKFHTIKLDGRPMPRRDSVRRPGDPLGMTASHVCRGHYKNFSPERPLFGRFSGQIWWNPQNRGKETNGTVAKKYLVSRPPTAGNV
jgi:hypothetical protein